VIILDTNVLSELMLPQPAQTVTAWLNQQAEEDIWTTSISVFEVRYGLARLDEGRRRRNLEDAFRALLEDDLIGRIASFDRTAAEIAGDLAARRRSAGRSIGNQDTQIAGIALARRASIATRNVRHFEGLGVPVLNPWDAT
jgi:predicted nucleic acid-binding protein